MKKLLVFIYFLVLVLSMSGCKSMIEPRSSKDVDKEQSLDTEATDGSDEDGKDSSGGFFGNLTTSNKGSNTGSDSDTDADSNSDTDADQDIAPDQVTTGKQASSDGQYALYCNDTVNIDREGLTTVYKLVLYATKVEGSGEGMMGTYQGSVLLDYGLDANQLDGINGAPIDGTGGFHVNMYSQDFTFDLQPFDLNNYWSYGRDPNSVFIAPLIEGLAMGLGTANMTGTANLGVTIDGSNGELHGESGDSSTDASGPLDIKFRVEEYGVEIYVPKLEKAMQAQSFEGILTQNPDIMKQAEQISAQEMDVEE